MKNATEKRKRKRRQCSPGPPYPEYVNVVSDDGSVQRIKCSSVLYDNEVAITDDIVFACKCQESENYIDQLYLQLRKQLRLLKKAIRENNDVLLRYDTVTGRYVVADKEE